MTKNKDPKKESLAEIAVDPDVLARELALEIEIDPLEQIDEDVLKRIFEMQPHQFGCTVLNLRGIENLLVNYSIH